MWGLYGDWWFYCVLNATYAEVAGGDDDDDDDDDGDDDDDD